MAISSRNRWVTPRYIKAMILLKQGRIDEADATIDDALKLKKFSNGYLTKGSVLEVKGDLAEAERYYRQALDMDRENTEAKMSVAHAVILNRGERKERIHEAELL